MPTFLSNRKKINGRGLFMRKVPNVHLEREEVIGLLRSLCELNDLNWGRFMQIYHPHIYSVVASKVYCADDREDVIQQIYEKLLENCRRLICQYEGTQENFVFYLKKIAVNTVKAYCKKNARNQKRCHSMENEAEPEDARISPEEVFLKNERIRLLAEAAEELSPAYREIIFLLAQGYNHREIAEKKGLSINTVLTRSSRARLALQKMIHNERPVQAASVYKMQPAERGLGIPVDSLAALFA